MLRARTEKTGRGRSVQERTEAGGMERRPLLGGLDSSGRRVPPAFDKKEREQVPVRAEKS